MSEDKFGAGAIVLVKVKGFSPWPAMVIPEDILPADILSKKPKPHPVSKNKKNSEIKIIAVRFFNDDSYVWTNDKNIGLLSEDVINSFLNDGKKRKDKLLIGAYKMALSPPDIDIFVKWGSYGEPVVVDEIEEDVEGIVEDEIEEDEEDEEEEEEEEEEEDEPPKKKRKVTKSKSKPKAKTAKSSAKKATKKATPKKPKPAPIIEEIIEEEEIESDFDSDWGFDEDDQKTPVCPTNFPKSTELTNSINERTPMLNNYKIELQELILNKDNYNNKTQQLQTPIKLKIIKIIKELSNLNNLQKSILVKTQINKFLFIVLRDFKFNDFDIRDKLNDLNYKWFSFRIEQDPEPEIEVIEEPVSVKDEGAENGKDDVVEVSELKVNGN